MKGFLNEEIFQCMSFSMKAFSRKGFSTQGFFNEGIFQCAASSNSRTVIFKGSNNFIFGHLKRIKNQDNNQINKTNCAFHETPNQSGNKTKTQLQKMLSLSYSHMQEIVFMNFSK